MINTFACTSTPGGLFSLIPSGIIETLHENMNRAVMYRVDIIDGFLTCHPVDNCLLLQFVAQNGELTTERLISNETNTSYITGHLRRDVFNIFMGVSTAARIAEINEDERLEQAVNVINESSYSVLRFANSLGEYLKYLSATKDAIIRTMDIDSFLNDICTMSSMVTNSIGISLSYHSCGEKVVVEIDEKKLVIAMLHIISNSCRFTREDNKIDIKLDVKESKAVITIADRGQGMNEDVIRKAFSPFFSSNPMDDSPAAGVGLGLPIARFMVLDMGGSIAMTSIEDVGTTIAISLPITQNPQNLPLKSGMSMVDMLRDRYSLLNVLLSDTCGVPMP